MVKKPQQINLTTTKKKVYYNSDVMEAQTPKHGLDLEITNALHRATQNNSCPPKP